MIEFDEHYNIVKFTNQVNTFNFDFDDNTKYIRTSSPYEGEGEFYLYNYKSESEPVEINEYSIIALNNPDNVLFDGNYYIDDYGNHVSHEAYKTTKLLKKSDLL